ncbi:MAG: substrate-binding domain-containing protein [Bacteroides sp.]|nr:substrate-binding domain-containing protein [Bacteroides sp.]
MKLTQNVIERLNLKEMQYRLEKYIVAGGWKTLCSVVMVILTVLLLSACGGSNKKKYRIGVSQCSGDYWRVKTNEDLERELLLHDDVELEIRSAENDNKRQTDDIKYFMDNGFDLIIISPNEAAAITPIVSEAYKKGIPVVTFDRSIEGDSYTAHMEVDNYELGKSVAHYALSDIRRPIRAIEIQGPASASPAQRRHQGFTDGLGEDTSARILASEYGNWHDWLAEQLADSLLTLYPDINLIYAHTDHMAIGAARAVEKHGRHDVAVMGIDGFPHVGIQAVKDGRLRATFLYLTEGERLLRLALAILEGEPYERINRVAPLSPIDSTNADILLSQAAMLDNETSKINFLRGELDEYFNRYSAQRLLLYAAAVIGALLASLLFLLLKTIHTNRQHQELLMQKNELLEEEKEKQKILYDRLSEATQSKLVFFTNISHDLRTPLTLIAGPVEQVGEAAYLTPRHKSLMKLAQKNVTILRRLIDQILDFRKYENGKTDLNLSEVNLSRLLKEWTDSFSEVARKHDINLVAEVPSESGSSVALDVEKMERVFFNLMSNAFKHTPDNGRITVSYKEAGDTVSFSVRDNGVGISEEDCGKIFDRFFQADKIGYKGSGIGLALTKAFIELHGGAITVESEKGKGSVFIVTLPIRHCENSIIPSESHITASAIETELATVENEAAEFDTEKPLLLVIDDNRDIRTLIGDLLGDTYNVIYAPDGQQGVKMAVKYVPDLIICDVMMPVMNGMECVRRLKEEISTSHIPVLMLTACSLDEQRAEGYNSGADGYLSKPFSGTVLEARCRNLLLNRKRIKELYESAHILGPQIIRKSETSPQPAAAARGDKDVENDFYSRFMEIVTGCLNDPELSVVYVAERIGLSQSQLTRKIKALTNYTPVEIIRTLRLRRAKSQLCATDKTISEIAFEVGFTSLAYFSKCYKEEFGESPSETRGRR